MARRNDHTPEELNEEVVERVLLFLQKSPADQLSLRKLAKLVGYSPGTLINHFGSYNHLILAANAKTLDQISDLLLHAMGQSPDPRKRLGLYAKRYWQFALDHPYQWQILFEHHLPEEDEVPSWQLNRIYKLFDIIELCLKEIKPNASALECHEASRTLWASVHGICALALDNKLFASNSLDINGMIDSLLTHFLRAWSEETPRTGDPV